MKERRKGVVERSSCRIYLHMSETHPRPPRTMRSAAINEKVQRGGKYSAHETACVACRFSAMGREKLPDFEIWVLGLVAKPAIRPFKL